MQTQKITCVKCGEILLEIDNPHELYTKKMCVGSCPSCKAYIGKIRVEYCKKCQKSVVLKLETFTERSHDPDDPEDIEGHYFTCSTCGTEIHHYPCWDWITEQSCAECRGIADEY